MHSDAGGAESFGVVQRLSDRAWAYAEELDMDILASEHGVPYYLEWIQTRFMDMEVTKISQMMGDLFRRCKKKPEQSVREFNVEFVCVVFTDSTLASDP